MTLDPIQTAPFETLMHLLFAVPAILLGPFVLFRTTRDRLHKTLGYVWVSAMGGLAITGLFIEGDFAVIGPFGPIHALSILALWGLAHGVYFARKGDVVGHQATMKSVWYGAIGVTGLLTFLPGRTLNRVLFGEPSDKGFVVIAMGLAWLLWLYLDQRKRTARRSPEV